MPAGRRPPAPATPPPRLVAAPSTEPRQPSCRPPRPRPPRPSPLPGHACPAARPVTASGAEPPRRGVPGKSPSAGRARWTRSPSRSGTGPRSAATRQPAWPRPAAAAPAQRGARRRPSRRQAPQPGAVDAQGCTTPTRHRAVITQQADAATPRQSPAAARRPSGTRLDRAITAVRPAAASLPQWAPASEGLRIVKSILSVGIIDNRTGRWRH